MGGGAISSGAYNIEAISSAWSVNGSGGSRGGASGCVRAARSVAVRSSSVSVSAADGQRVNDVPHPGSIDQQMNHFACSPILEREWKGKESLLT